MDEMDWAHNAGWIEALEFVLDVDKETLGDGALKELKKTLSKKGQGQAGKKRGPYKKRKKKSHIGGNTIAKYDKKINHILDDSLNFTREQLVEEVKKKHTDAAIAKMGGKQTLYEIRKAKWRLDSRRRRDDKIGIHSDPNYHKKARARRKKKKNG